MGLLDKLSALPQTGLVGSVVNLIGQARQNKWMSDQQSLQNQKNMELAKYQFELNKQMYDKSNIYNSPQMQMERFKQAGLNPNLIYGQGSSGNAPNVLPQYRAPEYEANIRKPVNISETLSSAIGTMMQLTALKNAQTEGKILESKATTANNEAFFSSDYYGFRNRGIELTNFPKSMFRDWALNINNQNEYSPKYSGYLDYLYGSKATAQLAKYNADIALQNAREQWQQKLIGGYMTPLAKTLWNAGTTIGSGLVRGGFNLIGRAAGLSKLAPKGLNPMGRYNPKINIYGK